MRILDEVEVVEAVVPCLEPNLKRIKNQKLGPQWTTSHSSIQLFSVMEFALLTVILPDVFSSIPPCGIFFSFPFFINNPVSSPSPENIHGRCWLFPVTLG